MSIFVASPVEVYYGHEAAQLLQRTNDSRFLSDRGILRVDQERWQQAQAYERETWLRYNLDAENDRNEMHQIGFGHYAMLPAALGDYIELGCGPFTNTRFIIRDRHLSSLTLLDPLIVEYERLHPHCTYAGWQMLGHVVNAAACAIEDWQPQRQYDTLVMINVLPHCRDAELIFERVRQALRPGGWLVFHEMACSPAPEYHYDAGHPLAVPQTVLDDFLSCFGAVYRRDSYFVGRQPGWELKGEIRDE